MLSSTLSCLLTLHSRVDDAAAPRRGAPPRPSHGEGPHLRADAVDITCDLTACRGARAGNNTRYNISAGILERAYTGGAKSAAPR